MKNQTQESQSIHFFELDLAAALECLHHNVSVQMISPTKARFSVPKTPYAEKEIESFWAGTLLVPPTQFLDLKFKFYNTIQKLKEEQQQ